MNYWLEALESSLDEHGFFNSIPKEKREAIAKDLEMGHQMHGEATGEINIPNPLLAEIKQLEAKREQDKARSETEIRIWREALAYIGGERPENVYYDSSANQIKVWGS